MNHLHSCLLALAFLAAATTAAHGQGSLTPPGPPGPTMKSLDQIEARTPIPGGTAPVTLSASGSYYLTGNLTVSGGDAITISATGVTLDLNGFTVTTSSGALSGTAVLLASKAFVNVGNGFIRGPGAGGGFVTGVGSPNGLGQGVVVHDLVISGGVTDGIKLGQSVGAGCRIERCTVDSAGHNGIEASTVLWSTAANCGATGIIAREAIGCSGSAAGTGLNAINAADCLGDGGTGDGVLCSGTAHGCKGTTTGGNGVSAQTAQNCQGTSASSFGLFATTATTCRGSSTSGIGLQVGTGTDCVGNTATGSFGAYGNIFTGSQGIATGGTGAGLQGYYTATNCLGISQGGSGLKANVATNCVGQTSGLNAYGVDVTIATGCNGSNFNGGSSFAVVASVTIGCTASQGIVISTYHYNEP